MLDTTACSSVAYACSKYRSHTALALSVTVSTTFPTTLVAARFVFSAAVDAYSLAAATTTSKTTCEKKYPTDADINAHVATNVTRGSRHVSTPRTCSATVATSSMMVWMDVIIVVSSSYCRMRFVNGFIDPAIFGAWASSSSESSSDSASASAKMAATASADSASSRLCFSSSAFRRSISSSSASCSRF